MRMNPQSKGTSRRERARATRISGLALLLVAITAGVVLWRTTRENPGRSAERAPRSWGVQPVHFAPEPLRDGVSRKHDSGIRVTIVGREDRPVADATLKFWRLAEPDTIFEFESDAAGVVEPEIPAGIYNVVVTARDYGRALRRVRLPGDVRIQLSPGCNLSARLLGFGSGDWANCVLRVDGVGGTRDTYPCDAELVDLGPRAPGLMHWVVVVSPRVEVPLEPVLLPAGRSLTVPIRAPSKAGIRLRVMDAESRSVVHGCRFAISPEGIYDSEGTHPLVASDPDEDGVVVLDAVPLAGCQLRIDAQGYAVSLVPMPRLPVDGSAPLEILLERGAAIRVVDRKGAGASLDAFVMSEPRRQLQVTPIVKLASMAPSGTRAVWRRNGYQFPASRRIPSGRIRRTDDGWTVEGVPAQSTVALLATTRRGVATHTFRTVAGAGSESGWNVEWPDVHEVAVRVVAGSIREPVPDAVVKVFEGRGVPAAARTDAMGVARFLGFVRGAVYELEVTSPRGRLRSKLDLERAISSGEFELRMESEPRREPMRVAVVDDRGHAVRGAVVQWLGPTSAPKFSTTDERGIAEGTRQSGSPAGIWTTKHGFGTAESEYGLGLPDRVVLSRGGTLDIEIRSPGSDDSLEIELVPEAARVNEAAPKSLEARAPPRTQRRMACRIVGGVGELQFEHLRAGTYVLRIWKRSLDGESTLVSSSTCAIVLGMRTKLRLVLD